MYNPNQTIPAYPYPHAHADAFAFPLPMSMPMLVPTPMPMAPMPTPTLTLMPTDFFIVGRHGCIKMHDYVIQTIAINQSSSN